MGSRPATPSNEPYAVNATAATRPRSMGSRPNSYMHSGGLGGESSLEQGRGPHADASPLAQSLNKHEDSYGLSRYDDPSFHNANHNMTGGELRRSSSQMSQSHTVMPSRGGTLKKKASLRKTGSIKRSSSRRSSRAGSVRSLALGEKEKYGEGGEFNSAFYTPVPTVGTPTDVLANRFQAWRKVLKDLITYFRDIQKAHDSRSKTLTTASNVINNITIPGDFLTSGGVGDATQILRDFHKQALNESNRAREMENEVILQLTGLRSDLQQKIKEIKSLSGDFKNSVDKEVDGSRKAVRHLQEALGMVESDPAAVAGKGDPFIVKLGVDRQIERQVEEENYLHRAYLNLESSGRELESIVVGEIQKAYTAYANILKHEADQAFDTTERLREGPLTMEKDHEWDAFVTRDDHMVDPRVPVRSFEHITYPGKDHPAATEVRSGMLERKSKYLKNYTPGWYILSPTHLHEFKSGDRIASQAPIMSLYLPEQKLGSHSEPASSSHKFMLKGRQTGGMHRGHAWVFRAESHDTMMAWYADIKELTEKSGKERDAFVRRSHARSLSGGSMKALSIGGSSDGGMEEDEADAQPYSSEQSVRGAPAIEMAGGDGHAREQTFRYGDEKLDSVGWRPPQRPSPGGRFPSDLKVHRGLQDPLSPSSGESSTERDRDAIAAAEGLPGSEMPFSQPPAAERHPPLHAGADSTSEQAPPGPDDQQPQKIQVQSTNEPKPVKKLAEYPGPAIAAGVAGTGAAAAVRPDGESTQQERGIEPVTEMTNAPTSSSQGTPHATMSVPSSHGDTGSLSTVPTSLGIANDGAESSQKPQTPFLHQPPEATSPTPGSASLPNDATTSDTKPVPIRSMTSGTLSDLHVPGEYPKTPSVAH